MATIRAAVASCERPEEKPFVVASAGYFFSTSRGASRSGSAGAGGSISGRAASARAQREAGLRLCGRRRLGLDGRHRLRHLGRAGVDLGRWRAPEAALQTREASRTLVRRSCASVSAPSRILAASASALAMSSLALSSAFATISRAFSSASSSAARTRPVTSSTSFAASMLRGYRGRLPTAPLRAMIETCGFTPGQPGRIEPSATQTPSMPRTLRMAHGMPRRVSPGRRGAGRVKGGEVHALRLQVLERGATSDGERTTGVPEPISTSSAPAASMIRAIASSASTRRRPSWRARR